MCSLPKGVGAFAIQQAWSKWYNQEEDPVSKAYAALRQGRPRILTDIHALIDRTDLTKAVMNIITPQTESRGYPLIIGERGTGKTSLLRLAVDEIEKSREAKSRGILYARIPSKKEKPLKVSQVIGDALGLDSSQGN